MGSSHDPPRRGGLPGLGQTRPMVRLGLHERLAAIDDALVAAALLVDEGIAGVNDAMQGGNTAAIDAAHRVSVEAADRCRQVDQEGFELLAREAPVASDLRRLVALLRLVTATERSAAMVRHVAESMTTVDVAGLAEPVRRTITELGVMTGDVYRRGLDAWRRRDALAVTEVNEADRRVNRLREELVEHARSLAAPAEILALGLLGRYFERIADHGVTFARSCTWAETGERVLETGH